jgi:hypothetical protein
VRARLRGGGEEEEEEDSAIFLSLEKKNKNSILGNGLTLYIFFK